MAAPVQYLLHAPAEGMRIKKILIAAKYAGVDLVIPAGFEMGVTNKTPDFLRMNPMGKVPVLETPDGIVCESNAIARYVAGLGESGLLGKTPLQEAQISQWLDFSSNEVEAGAFPWIAPILGYMPYDAELTKKGKARVMSALTGLDAYLARRTYLVGQRLSLADIVVACSLFPLYKMVLAPPMRKSVDHVNRWFELITQQGNFYEVWPMNPNAWCTVPRKPMEPKKEKTEEKKAEAESTGAAAGEGGEGGKKGKKDKKKKKDDDDDEEEEAVPQEKAAPNPLDALPKSSFVLDAYKREYSNKTIEESMAYFWENVDKEGWSLHFCTYKYNDELTKSFMTTNLVGGYFQRLDRARKYSFGVMSILGEEAKHEIQGCWLFRGPEVPDVVKSVDDTELYEWTKIEWADLEGQKARVQAFWNCDAVEGKECMEAKVFK